QLGRRDFVQIAAPGRVPNLLAEVARKLFDVILNKSHQSDSQHAHLQVEQASASGTLRPPNSGERPYLIDDTNVNHSIVKDGWCWWGRKSLPGDTVLEGLEKEARKGRKGLWSILRLCRRGRGRSGNLVSIRLIAWR